MLSFFVHKQLWSDLIAIYTHFFHAPNATANYFEHQLFEKYLIFN